VGPAFWRAVAFLSVRRRRPRSSWPASAARL